MCVCGVCVRTCVSVCVCVFAPLTIQALLALNLYYLRLAVNSHSSCLHLPSAGSTGVHATPSSFVRIISQPLDLCFRQLSLSSLEIFLVYCAS